MTGRTGISLHTSSVTKTCRVFFYKKHKNFL